jgi:RNA polymerase sigma-70 factor (ECF subfamily)
MRKSFRSNEVVTEYARTLIRVKAKQLIRRPGFSQSDQEDVEQDLVLHLLSQSKHYDPARGSLNTFVARVVNSAVAMMVRERKRRKRGIAGGVTIQSLAVIVEQPDEPPTPLATLISADDLKRRTGGNSLDGAELYELVSSVTSAIESLPPELQRICCSLVNRTRSDTVRELGLSRRTFQAAMDQLREHFTRAGFGKN